MSLYSVLLIFILSISSCVISGVILFGDAIVWYVQVKFLNTLFPSTLHGIPGLSEPDENGDYPEISSIDLFNWSVRILSVRALVLNIVMVILCRREIRLDYLIWCCPLAMFGSYVGCVSLTNYGRSEYLPYFFAAIFGTFASIMLFMRVRRLTSTSKEKEESVAAIEENKEEETNSAEIEVTIDEDEKNKEKKSIDELEQCSNTDESTTAASAVPKILEIPSFSRGYDGSSNKPISDEDLVAEQKIKIEALEKERKKQQRPPTADAADLAKLNDPNYISKTKFSLVCVSAISGFTGGISNVASSPLVTINIWFEFPKTLSRGTNNYIFLVIFIVRVIYNHFTGEVELNQNTPELISMCGAGCLGLFIGNYFATKISTDQFILIVTCMLLNAALTLGGAPLGILLTCISLEIIYCKWEFTREDDEDEKVVYVMPKKKKTEEKEIDDVEKQVKEETVVENKE